MSSTEVVGEKLELHTLDLEDRNCKWPFRMSTPLFLCSMGQILGAFSGALFGKKEPTRIMMVGLPNAGKTTILHKLKLGEQLPRGVLPSGPTVGFNVETVECNNISLAVWDIGGGDKMQDLWKHFFQNIQGLIFVVDSNDRKRIEEARKGLKKLLSENELKNVVLLCFANKQDLPDAMSAAKVAEKLELNSLQDRKWHIEPTLATSGDGLHQGLDWLCGELKAHH